MARINDANRGAPLSRPAASSDPSTPIDSIENGARIGINNVIVYLDADDPRVEFDLINTGERPASGLVYGVWAHVDQFSDDNPPINQLEPNPEFSYQILGAGEKLSRAISLIRPGDVATSSLFHGHDQEAPLSPESWEFVSAADIHNLLVEISVSYWDGSHHKRSVVSHHVQNPDNGLWHRTYYEEKDL